MAIAQTTTTRISLSAFGSFPADDQTPSSHSQVFVSLIDFAITADRDYVSITSYLYGFMFKFLKSELKFAYKFESQKIIIGIHLDFFICDS